MSAREVVPARESVQTFSLKLRLARSAELALAGSLLRAEELLMPDGCLPGTAEELDLLARILVQQKRYAEAQKRWKEALDISGGKNCYQDALDLLGAYISNLQRKKKVLLIVGNILIFLAAWIVSFFMLKLFLNA